MLLQGGTPMQIASQPATEPTPIGAVVCAGSQSSHIQWLTTISIQSNGVIPNSYHGPEAMVMTHEEAGIGNVTVCVMSTWSTILQSMPCVLSGCPSLDFDPDHALSL
jgi:hypothetical protein